MSKHQTINFQPDILVVGGGNAALTAAITARKFRKTVVVLEAAPCAYRGGNSRHTRNFRCMHRAPLGVLSDQYSEDEFLDDLLKVTRCNTNETLARIAIRESESMYHWMEEHGVRFQPSLSGTLSLSQTNAFFLGGGKALLNALYATAEDLGVELHYDAEVTHLVISSTEVNDVYAHINNQELQFKPSSVIVASGGFQADIDGLCRAWGQAARNFIIRGTPFNKGQVLNNLLQQNMLSVGDPTQCHAVAIDGRSPKFDGGIVTRLDCVPFSVVVNHKAERFYDEGEDLWPKRYAIWGRLIAHQQDQIAYSIIDSQSINLFMPSVFPPVRGDSIEELAQNLALPAKELAKTLQTFNTACRAGHFDPNCLDGLGTVGLKPQKSNWARPIDQPPFYGYPLRPGVTFTYLGLKIDESARVESRCGPMANLWAAGEIMAGSILGEGYLAGFGMTIGSVFGRIAGQEAARHV